ncbi:hypothetical protein O0L34_g19386 [Tuta absoluta]|nr:hypothetical protein O0L34_g19386 [Tuta absoluta]
MYETRLSIVQSKYPKIISRRGKKQIGAMLSAKRGSLITIVTCMSPAGIFVPPMMIFPRKNISDRLMKGDPVRSIGRARPSAWIQTHLFTQWFEHFIDYVQPFEASPVLLLFDGHYSHTKNIELIDKARENHVTLVSLPPHCTHKIQPMDKSFMGPLKTYYSEEIHVWLRQNNKPLTAYNIAELFGKLTGNVRQEKLQQKALVLEEFIHSIGSHLPTQIMLQQIKILRKKIFKKT